MALYAANNICQAVKNFEDRSYATVGGIVLNHRNVENELSRVEMFAKDHGLEIVAQIPKAMILPGVRMQAKPVLRARLRARPRQEFMRLAERLIGKVTNEQSSIIHGR